MDGKAPDTPPPPRTNPTARTFAQNALMTWPAAVHGGRRVHQGDGAALHGDPAHLLLLPRVQEAELPGQAGVDEAIGGDQVVRQRGLSVIHMREHAHIANPLLYRTRIVERG